VPRITMVKPLIITHKEKPKGKEKEKETSRNKQNRFYNVRS